MPMRGCVRSNRLRAAAAAELAAALTAAPQAGELPDLAALRARFEPAPASSVPPIAVALPALVVYDALLSTGAQAACAGAWA